MLCSSITNIKFLTVLIVIHKIMPLYHFEHDLIKSQLMDVIVVMLVYLIRLIMFYYRLIVVVCLHSVKIVIVDVMIVLNFYWMLAMNLIHLNDVLHFYMFQYVVIILFLAPNVVELGLHYLYLLLNHGNPVL